MTTQATQDHDYLGTDMMAAGQGKKFPMLAEGAAQAIVAGLIVQNFKKFESEELAPKVTLVFQVHGEANTPEAEPLVKYLKTTPYTISGNEKSGIMKMLMTWTKAKSPAEVADLLKNEAGKFDLYCLLGKSAMLTVGHEESKKDAKVYESIDLVSRNAKKTIEFDVKAELPAFIHSPKNPVLQSQYLPGLVLAREMEAVTDVVLDGPTLEAMAEALAGDEGGF